MCTKYYIVALLVLKNSESVEYDGTLQVLTDFFIQRHVQTVTAHTCWPSDVDEKLLKKLSSNDISVSFLCPLVRQTRLTWYKHAFLVDLSCEKSRDIFRQTSNDRLFDAQNDWVLLSENLVAKEINKTLFALNIFESYLGDAYVLPDSAVFLFQKTDEHVWTIWNGFRASKSDAMRVHEIDAKSPGHLITADLYDERRNFRGITLKANTVIVNKDTFFGFDKKISSDLDIFSHMHYEMIHILSKQLNFKIDLGVNSEYGWSYGNGTFGGLMGLLQADEIDFSAAGVLIRADRLAVVDYTIGTIPFRQPSLSSVHNILLLPFTLELWLVILVVCFVFVFVLAVLTRTSRQLKNKKTNSTNVQEIIILVHGAICQQGTSFKTDSESARVMIFVMFFTSLFVFTSYSASIAALIQSNSNSIKSIRDILESPMTFSAHLNPYAKHYFEESEDPLIKSLYKRKMIPTGNKAFINALEGMEKIRTEFHGFMVEVTAAYKIISNEWREEEKCGLADIELFQLPPLSIPLVKKSGHRDLFKQKLIQQLEVGLGKRIASQWISPKPSCDSSGRAKLYDGVSIRDVYLTLKVLGCGLCISIGILTLEVISFHYWTNRQQREYPVVHARRWNVIV